MIQLYFMFSKFRFEIFFVNIKRSISLIFFIVEYSNFDWLLVLKDSTNKIINYRHYITTVCNILVCFQHNICLNFDWSIISISKAYVHFLYDFVKECLFSPLLHTVNYNISRAITVLLMLLLRHENYRRLSSFLILA